MIMTLDIAKYYTAKVDVDKIKEIFSKEWEQLNKEIEEEGSTLDSVVLEDFILDCIDTMGYDGVMGISEPQHINTSFELY